MEAFAMADEKVSDEFELTEREIALCKGEDPDAASAEQNEEPGNGTEAVDEGKEAPQVAEQKTEEEKPASWIDEDVKSQAASYGMSEEELAGFKDVNEFRRAGKLVDRHLVKAGKTVEATPPAKVADEKPTTETASPAAEEDLSLDPEQYVKDGYDEQTVKLVRFASRLKKDIESIRESEIRLRRDQTEANNRHRLAMFHSEADRLNRERYGESTDADGRVVKLTDEQDARRRTLWETVDTIASGIAARAAAEGKRPEFPSFRVLLRRAEQLAFGEELRKDEQKQMQEKLASQSKRRRPIPGAAIVRTPPGGGSGSKGDPIRAIVDHPDLVKLWNGYQEANGAM
jgi:hypothetical protein